MAWTTLVEAGSLDELNAAIRAIDELPKWTKLRLRVKLPFGSLAGIVLQGSCCYSNGCPVLLGVKWS